MDLKHTTTIATAYSPDTDGEPPLNSQQIRHFSSYPIGKNHHHLQPPPTVVLYKQCLKNHAATIGSHALDGCGEFMPSLTCTPHEPTSLKCAACGCHRNFHRREPISDVFNYATYQNQLIVATPGTLAAIKLESPHERKRFRTKFSQNQKEKMYFFAERVGWKMQRCDDKMVLDLCNEIGIKRGVLKVWMHNNKNTLRKKDKETSPITGTGTGTVGVSNKSNDGYNNGNSSLQENGAGGGGIHVHASNNGSSSSC